MTMFDRKRRESFLDEKLEAYLGRKAAPRNLPPRAQTETMAALERCLGRYAPKEGYEDWWPRFEDRLEEDSKTWAWPTVGEIKAAAIAITEPGQRRVSQADDLQPLKVAARRMENGEPVGDGHLYGRMAVDLIAAGLVDETTMKRYRSGLFGQLKATYGETQALDMEAKLKARHEAARQSHSQQSEPRDLPMPELKTMVGE